MKKAKTIRSLFSLSGFTANAHLKGVFDDRYSRIITLRRRKKAAICFRCWHRCKSRYDRKTLRVRDLPVAEIERPHHSTVKDLDKLYMRRQVELAGTPTPRAIGVD